MARFTLCFLLAVVAPMVVLQPAVHAQPAQPAQPDKATRQAAKAYVDAGLAAQNRGDHDTAITFYSKAYELVSHPVLLFNIAQAHRLAGRMEQAVDFYQKFLATNPAGPEAQIARDLLAEIAKRKAAQARREAAQARRAEEARKGEQAPAAGDAGKADGAAPGAEPSNAVRAPADSQAPMPPEAGAWSTKRKVAVGMAGGGVLALAVGAVLGISAKSKQDDAHALCADPRLPCGSSDRANDLVRSGHSLAIGADVALGIGAAAMIAGSVLWFTGGQESPRRVAVVPAASPGQIFVSASGTF